MGNGGLVQLLFALGRHFYHLLGRGREPKPIRPNRLISAHEEARGAQQAKRKVLSVRKIVGDRPISPKLLRVLRSGNCPSCCI